MNKNKKGVQEKSLVKRIGQHKLEKLVLGLNIAILAVDDIRPSLEELRKEFETELLNLRKGRSPSCQA